MFEPSEPVQRLDIPDFRLAEVAILRAAEKAQHRIREAGFEPVNSSLHTPFDWNQLLEDHALPTWGMDNRGRQARQ